MVMRTFCSGEPVCGLRIHGLGDHGLLGLFFGLKGFGLKVASEPVVMCINALAARQSPTGVMMGVSQHRGVEGPRSSAKTNRCFWVLRHLLNTLPLRQGFFV